MNAQRIERYELQREFFGKALNRLLEALEVDETAIVRDALIQRFEFTFEMAWKTLFRYLADRGETMAAKAWDVIPVAFESKLIDDAEVWDRMREYRNDLSHEYNEAKAIELSAFIRSRAAGALVALRDKLAARPGVE
jgi:nucleotidyltransferase substrate binding protein (TIGR01987 family)